MQLVLPDQHVHQSLVQLMPAATQSREVVVVLDEVEHKQGMALVQKLIHEVGEPLKFDMERAEVWDSKKRKHKVVVVVSSSSSSSSSSTSSK